MRRSEAEKDAKAEHEMSHERPRSGPKPRSPGGSFNDDSSQPDIMITFPHEKSHSYSSTSDYHYTFLHCRSVRPLLK